jgi:hypothetical protein
MNAPGYGSSISQIGYILGSLLQSPTLKPCVVVDPVVGPGNFIANNRTFTLAMLDGLGDDSTSVSVRVGR